MKKKLAIVKAIEEQHVQQLLALFPKGDSEYFKACLEYYNENAVERIAEKILVDMGGQYPQLPIPSQPHDNRLNASLRILALDLFPSCDISYLRELVLNFSYAHIEQVVEVLTCTAKWPERLDYGKMDPSEGIRSEKYKKQAQAQLTLDYPQVWKSSIRAVLAENNWDYLKCFEQLKEMGSGGFWKTLRNFFSHWSASSSVHVDQAVTDYHLLEQLKELRQHDIDKQIAIDQDYAYKMNTREYTHHGQLMTCLCCYSDYTFEELSFCSEGEHAFCHGCLVHYISEGLFGQGELRGQPSIGCISSSNDECKGVFATTTLKRILTDDIWMAYENSLLEGGISEHDRIQCCACSYFEVDESTKPLASTLIYASKWIRSLTKWIMWDMKADLEIAYQRVSKSRRSSVFNCKRDGCNTVTCLECHRPVRGLHTCWEQETDGLRLYVEKAMADAVKRTCPNCSLSFQKSDGCNKIVCRCGYAMCYICRKDIGEESYNHFCQHFRARPGSNCSSCNKCDLYKTAPDDEAVQLAATRAKNQYLQAHPDIHTTNLVIGPKRTLDRLVELRQELVITCLEKGLQYIV
ncbi:uncharacterized protein EV154DRAFT_526343 [Mucor mucedo]|uniref:uncharacterized protein n=1 Tax=Mucor mucedo TaxID=29922 RepID=UPI00221E7A5D|nr:uncharacterized protein EV154DRAFT_526343 [Mucor mucedo]KAI7875831.1 hypothetical protein EV154DRAFT_526343 [Mucor mucedo]